VGDKSLYDVDDDPDIGIGKIIFGGVITLSIIGMVAFWIYMARDLLRGGSMNTLYWGVTVGGIIVIIVVLIIGYFVFRRKKDPDYL
jgi:hypothetical protein